MTTHAAAHINWQGVPSTVGRLRPTAAVSGGEGKPFGDGRVQHQPTRCAVVREAVISPDGLYRYTLSRRWGSGPRAMFVGLNPSRADGDVDDHSTRRMIRFAQAAGCGGLTLVNLYAWRSPSPRTLRQVPDPVGPGNDHWICSAVAAADLVVAAWGILAHPDRIAVVADLLQHSTVWCLGRTKHGHPRHPLYVPANTPLEVFTAAESPHDWSEWQRVADPQAADLVERACLACGGDEIGVGHADAMELS